MNNRPIVTMNTKELSKRYSVLLKRYWDIKSALEGSSVKSGDKKKKKNISHHQNVFLL